MTMLLRRLLSILLIVIAAFVTEYHFSESMKAADAKKGATQRIEMLIASGKQVLDLSDLKHLREVPGNIIEQPKWLQINLNGTNISDISFVKDLEELKLFSLRKTRVDDLNAISNINGMTSLDIGETLVHDLSPISELNELERLDIGSNVVASLRPLTQNKRLKWLNLHSSYAYDGSKQHYDALTAIKFSDVYHGNAYKQNYVPGLMYRSFASIKRLWKSLELDRAYTRWFG